MNIAGKTPLWTTKSTDVIQVFMQFTPSEVYKRVLSDDIEEVQSVDLVQVLIQQHSWNPNNGDAALHLACKADRVAVVKHLLSMEGFNGDPCAKNMLGQTPLELTSSIEIINELFDVNPIDILTNPIIDEESI